MGGTFDPNAVRGAALDSLFGVTTLYARRANGDLQYDGKRPGRQWHAHGWYLTEPTMLAAGRPVQKRLWKHRWRLSGTNTTCHSEPPDLCPRFRSCTLIVLLTLWSWLDSGDSLLDYRQLFEHLEGHATHRTQRRWLEQAAEQSLSIQQAIRHAAIERCEPRPIEELFPSGLPPPESLLRRKWRDPAEVSQLWRGLAIALGTSIELAVPTAILLAEARGRMSPKQTPSQ
jgi:hypothetical protein